MAPFKLRLVVALFVISALGAATVLRVRAQRGHQRVLGHLGEALRSHIDCAETLNAYLAVDGKPSACRKGSEDATLRMSGGKPWVATMDSELRVRAICTAGG